jgi:ribosomal-protein-alanine N-acetyltransferase
LAHWSEQAYWAVFQPGAPERILLLAENIDQLCGFLIARFGASECELENIVVSPAIRRRGIASQILNRLIAAARERHLEHIHLEVRESNLAARGLYQKLGFEPSGRRRAYYRNPQEDALTFTLRL